MRFRRQSEGFALPTIVIVSVMLFSVLVVAVGTVSSISASLNDQYYQSLSRDVAESGATYISRCLGDSLFSVGVTVKPNTDCNGNVITGSSEYEINNGNYRTTFAATLESSTGKTQVVSIEGKVQRLRQSTGAVYESSSFVRKLGASMVVDPNGDRGSQRYWYFGDRTILDFGVSGSALPTPLRNASGTTPAPLAYEGTTVVSDVNGNLQFWTDGRTIWDKTGTVMQNSAGLNGGQSATQAVASFPLNSNRTKYGVVSNSGQGENGAGELYLSVVDMTANGGNGAVTTKNQRLGSTEYAHEGLGAMPNNNGTGYYVYAYSSTLAKITSFLIKTDATVSGPFVTNLSPTPQICDYYTYPVSNNLTGYGSFNFTKGFNSMILLIGTQRCNTGVTGTAYLFDTNSATGALSLKASWVTANNNVSDSQGYTADFSPDEKYVYVSSIYPGVLTRYNIQDLASIKSSEWSIGRTSAEPTLPSPSGGQVRRGPDDRMYVADRAWVGKPTCYITYVNTPDATENSIAAIGFNVDGLTLAPNSCSWWGLPQTATVFKPKIVLF